MMVQKNITKEYNYSFQEAYRYIYNDFIIIHPNITWKEEFCNCQNKLEYLMNKDINYLKELRDITTTYLGA